MHAVPLRLASYKYTCFFLLSLLFGAGLFVSGTLHTVAELIRPLGYFGAFLNGLLFSSALTSAIAALLFVELGNTLSPIPTAIIGGVGAMVSDLILYRFFRNKLFFELRGLAKILFSRERLRIFFLLLHKPYLRILLPILGGLIIASPFPDEIGIALFGLVDFRPKFLSILTFVLNTTGIFTLLSIGRAF